MSIRIEAFKGYDNGVDYDLPDSWDLATAIEMCQRIDEAYREAEAVGMTVWDLGVARLRAQKRREEGNHDA
ncbi:hypothetical protein ACFVWR_19095 [Leifsonia sp. NPDC058292]|uniref:hypothetical protein n=1 Tax=Leifsonia sp. NPDC058292 TaxID=3346428 RepID=UPI0036DE2E04